MLHVELTTIADCTELAPNLREADLAEVRASGGLTGLEALLTSQYLSKACWSIKDGYETIGMFGVGTHTKFREIGIPWLLASEQLKLHSRQFLRGCRTYVDLMQSWYPTLSNMVDARNTTACRWLEWCGFHVAQVIPEYGVEKIPFVQYVRYRNV